MEMADALTQREVLLREAQRKEAPGVGPGWRGACFFLLMVVNHLLLLLFLYLIIFDFVLLRFSPF